MKYCENKNQNVLIMSVPKVGLEECQVDGTMDLRMDNLAGKGDCKEGGHGWNELDQGKFGKFS